MSVEEHTSKFFESSYDGNCLLFQCSIIFAMTLSVAREVGYQTADQSGLMICVQLCNMYDSNLRSQ